MRTSIPTSMTWTSACERRGRLGDLVCTESRVIHLEGASTGITGVRRERRRPRYWFEARRRYFVKNYGALYTALVDAAFILGFSLSRLHLWIRRRPESAHPSC